MKVNKKIYFYSGLVITGLLSFILQVFVFEKPDGILGFFLCLTSIYLMIGGVIKLCKSSKQFKNFLLEFLDALFWLP